MVHRILDVFHALTIENGSLAGECVPSSGPTADWSHLNQSIFLPYLLSLSPNLDTGWFLTQPKSNFLPLSYHQPGTHLSCNYDLERPDSIILYQDGCLVIHS
jgi:hypothetical protein